MWISKGLVFGVVCALALGAVETWAQGAVAPAPSDAGTTQALTVPVGMVGDRVVFERSQNLTPGLTDPFSGWTPEWGLDGFQVESVGEQVDSTGLPHPVVWMVEQESFVNAGGLAGREWSTSGNQSEWWGFDLNSREFIALRLDSQSDRTNFFAQRSQDERAFVGYGPFSALDNVDPEIRYRGMPFYHQGRTYQVGDDLPDYSSAILASDPGLIDYWGYIDVHDVTARAWVAGAGSIDGRDALDLRAEGCLRIVPSSPSFWVYDPGSTRVFGLPVPLPSRICFAIDQWVTADVPYPLLTDVRITVNGTEALQLRSSLAAYEAGASPIPWQMPPMNGVYRTEQPGLEHSPVGELVPADGEGLDWSYPPSAAIRAVEADPSLRNLRAWRAEHPQAFLAGLSLAPSGSDGAGRIWRLTFAQPDGVGFVVRTEKTNPAAPSVQTETGQIETTPFLPEQFPDAPITFAEAQRLRAKYGAKPEAELEPNFVGWGLGATSAGLHCDDIENCRPALESESRLFAPDVIDLANTAAYEAFGGVGARTGPADDAMQGFVSLGTGHGALYRSNQRHRETTIEPLSAADDFQWPEPKAAAHHPTPTRFEVGNAAVVSSSLLALFLAMYFLPSLKFAATRFGLLIPGYAKTEPSALMQNKVRETIVNAIRADPGVTPPQLQKISRVAWSTVVYHLQMLERNKLVSSLLDGRHRRYFPVDDVNWSDRGRIAALKNAKTRELYELILQEPGVGPGDLAKKVYITRPAVYWHIDRLEAVGLVGRDRVRLRTALFANPEGKESPYDPRSAVEVA